MGKNNDRRKKIIGAGLLATNIFSAAVAGIGGYAISQTQQNQDFEAEKSALLAELVEAEKSIQVLMEQNSNMLSQNNNCPL